MFEKLWGILIKSPTVAEYEFNHRRFHDTLIVHHSRVYYYVKTNWLDKYKEMFASAWIDQNLNFCNNTMNRVEGAHALLKKYLLTSNSTLDKFVVVIDRIVAGRESALKETFEISRNKVMNKHNIPLLNELGGCGSHVRTNCGLPCACLVSKYLTSGRAISLDVVDIFWRKLDFNPLYVEQEDDLECEKDLELFRQQLSQESRAGKRSMLSKLWAIIKPGSSNRGNPEIHKKHTRTSNDKVQAEKQARTPLKRSNSTSLTGTESLYQRMPSQEDTGRHSSFVGTVDASRQSSAVFSNTMPYSHYYLHLVHPYLCDFVKRIQDVGADGNYGFRAAAVVLGFHEDSWLWIRQQLITKITAREGQYKHIYGEDFYRTIHRLLNWSSESFAPREHWMDMPSTAFMIANRFGVVVHSLSCTEGQNSTIFPMFYGPHEVQGHGAISILYIGEHFVVVELEEEYPMPSINFQWLDYRLDVAVGWEELYRLRVKKFNDQLHKDNPEPIKQTIDLGD